MGEYVSAWWGMSGVCDRRWSVVELKSVEPVLAPALSRAPARCYFVSSKKVGVSDERVG